MDAENEDSRSDGSPPPDEDLLLRPPGAPPPDAEPTADESPELEGRPPVSLDDVPEERIRSWFPESAEGRRAAEVLLENRDDPELLGANALLVDCLLTEVKSSHYNVSSEDKIVGWLWDGTKALYSIKDGRPGGALRAKWADRDHPVWWIETLVTGDPEGGDFERSLLRLSAWLAGDWRIHEPEHRERLREVAPRLAGARARAEREGVTIFEAAKREVLAVGIVRFLSALTDERKIRLGSNRPLRDPNGEVARVPFWGPDGLLAYYHLLSRSRTHATEELESLLASTRPRHDSSSDGSESDEGKGADDSPLASALSLQKTPPDSDRRLIERLEREEQSLTEALGDGEDRLAVLLSRAEELGHQLNLTERREEILRERLRHQVAAHGEDVSSEELNRRTAAALGDVKPGTVRQTLHRIRGG